MARPPSSVTGHELGEGGGYGDPVEWHERLGIALGVVGLLIGIACWRFPKAYGPLLVLGCLLVVPTSHLGGVLTHGEDFFPLPFGDEPEPVEVHEVLPSQAETFATTIGPLFRQYCIKCHGPRKQKAELVLHTYEGLVAGSEEGPVIVPGDGAGSELVKYMRLPLEHDEHMPPEGKPQPTPDEIEAIVAWIDEHPPL